MLILRVPGGQEIGSDDVEVSFRDGFSVAVSADPDGLVPLVRRTREPNFVGHENGTPSCQKVR